MIVNHNSPVTLIGGGHVGRRDLNRSMAIAPKVIAADGGASFAVASGVVPDAVIGDFDSLDATTRSTLQEESLYHFKDQDSTDFDKCLQNISAPIILGVGFTGARFDHHLANLNSLVRFANKRCILLGELDITFLAPPSLTLDLPKGCPVSLFPLGAVEGVSDGLKWPITGLNLAPDGRISTSNEATGCISLSVTSPKMLVILPEKYFETVAQALSQTRAVWP